LPEFNQLLLYFFNLFDSRLTLTLLYDSLNLVINAFSSGLLGSMVREKGSQQQSKLKVAEEKKGALARYPAESGLEGIRLGKQIFEMRFTYACKIYGDKDQCECFIQNLLV